MWFGEIKTANASGSILAHALKLPDGKRLPKGSLLDDDAVRRILGAGIEHVIVARLAGDDVGEDDAAMAVAQLFSKNGIRLDRAGTGRVNLYAKHDGVFCVDEGLVNKINAVDPAITVATLSQYHPVNEGRMVGTIKIIPYGVKASSIEQVIEFGRDMEIVRISAYQRKRIGVISTLLPSLKPTVIDKTLRILEGRLAPAGASIVREVRVSHDATAVAKAIAGMRGDVDLIILFGASAISDINDVIPQAIRENNGDIVRFGMPVDPGNLMLMAKLENLPVIGAPGCARSPAENGFDWVLSRTLAGLEVGSEAIAGLGVGGLLMEISTRPQPREKAVGASGIEPQPKPKTVGIILAAGQSRRMGEVNKLAAQLWGKALVRHVGEAASRSNLDAITVVTGHEAETVHALLDGLNITYVHNPAYEEGLSSSLKAGITSVGGDFDQALILLGDMPFVTHEMINRMLSAASPSKLEKPTIVMASNNGKRGNPVLWPRAFFGELAAIEGDVGARHIIGRNQENVIDVDLGEAASLDLDTPEALIAAGGDLPDGH